MTAHANCYALYVSSQQFHAIIAYWLPASVLSKHRTTIRHVGQITATQNKTQVLGLTCAALTA